MSYSEDDPKQQELETAPILTNQAESHAKSNFIIFASSIFILNFDTGIFPLSVKLIMNDIGINHAEVAFMGTCVNAGLSVGSLFVPYFYRKYEARSVLMIALGLHMVALTIFSVISDYKTMVLMRFLSGIVAGAHLIYVPVWINNFGPKGHRATWLGYVGLANPIGTTFGTLVSFFFLFTVHHIYKWRLPIAVQMAVEGLLMIFFYRMKNEQIDVTEKSEADNHNHIPRDMSTFFKDIWRVIQCPMVIVGTSAYCFFYFTMAGIQFWSVLYMQVIYGVDKNVAVILYISISMVACVTGIYSGGYIVDRMGGYDRDNWTRTSYILASFAFTSLIFGIISCIQGPFYLFAGSTLLCVTTVLATNPGSAGMVLTSIDPKDQNIAVSFSHFFYDTVGFFLAPIVFGAIIDGFGGKKAGLIWGWRFGISVLGLLNISLIGFIYFAHRNNKRHKRSAELAEEEERSKASVL